MCVFVCVCYARGVLSVSWTQEVLSGLNFVVLNLLCAVVESKQLLKQLERILLHPSLYSDLKTISKATPIFRTLTEAKQVCGCLGSSTRVYQCTSPLMFVSASQLLLPSLLFLLYLPPVDCSVLMDLLVTFCSSIITFLVLSLTCTALTPSVCNLTSTLQDIPQRADWANAEPNLFLSASHSTSGGVFMFYQHTHTRHRHTRTCDTRVCTPKWQLHIWCPHFVFSFLLNCCLSNCIIGRMLS